MGDAGMQLGTHPTSCDLVCLRRHRGILLINLLHVVVASLRVLSGGIALALTHPVLYT